MQWCAIVLLSISASVLYGILHDQVTARICVEYFTIGHVRIIESEDPTILGLLWGFIATWWVGLILGVPLATLARFGSLPKRSATSLIRPLGILLCCNAVLAGIAGCVGYVAAMNGWVWLAGRLSEAVPRDKHVAFLVDLWAHSASYAGAAVGGVVLMIAVVRWRWRAHFERSSASVEMKS